MRKAIGITRQRDSFYNRLRIELLEDRRMLSVVNLAATGVELTPPNPIVTGPSDPTKITVAAAFKPMIDLGTLGGASSIANAINASGEVVGDSAYDAAGDNHAFLYKSGKMIDLKTLGGADSYAYGINASGEVVGSSTYGTSANNHAFLYNNGKMTDLGTLGGTYSCAYGINDNGQIVGCSTNAKGQTDAFLYSNGTMTDLGTLPAGTFSCAYAVNASGQIVGDSGSSNGTVAFLYAGGKMTELVAASRYGSSYAYGVNRSGQVVGVLTEVNTSIKLSTFSFGFFYSNGMMVDPGSLNGDEDVTARGINDSGEIVGSSNFDPNGAQRAFFYVSGNMFELGTLGGAGSQALAINDNGQIVGQSATTNGQQHAFLLNLGVSSSTTVRATTLQSPYGQPVTITTTVATKPGLAVPTGDVTFEDGYYSLGTVNLSTVNGVATASISIPKFAVGSHDINVIYSGCPNYAPGVSNLLVETVSSGFAPMIDLGTIPGNVNSIALGINNSGQVVGRAGNSGDGLIQAFQYSNGKMTGLNIPTAADSFATGINDSGQTVGYYFPQNYNDEAFEFSNGTETDLGTLNQPGYITSVAYAINDSGQVVGKAGTEFGDYLAFLYINGTMTDLGTLGGSESCANAINDDGQVVGDSWNARGHDHAFLYSNGTMTDLGSLGGTTSQALGINNLGQVVGWSYTASGAMHAFLYSNGSMTDLGTLPGSDESCAYGINDNGQVVGYSDIAEGGQHAFLYGSGKMTDLGTLAGGVESVAYAINDKGQVVGSSEFANGGGEHAFLLATAPSATTITITSSIQQPIYGQQLTLTASVKAANGGVPVGTVQYLIDGKDFGKELPLDASGKAKLATSVLPAGIHAITADYTSNSTRFLSSTTNPLHPFEQAVNRASLTIAAVNKSKVYGNPNPALTITYTGFVNGDGVTALSRQAIVTTTATVGSAAGAYPITVSGAASSNYMISYASAMLTVYPAVTKPSIVPGISGAMLSSDKVDYDANDAALLVLMKEWKLFDD